MLEVVILAGGFGTRLREVVDDVPKPMAPICGKPFLAILLCMLANKGVERVVLSVGYMSDIIRQYFGERYKGIDITYAVEVNPLGTGGAIKLAMDMVKSDHALILNGDTFLDLEYVLVESLWKKKNKPIIVGKVLENTERYGRLLINENRVEGFQEKGVTGKGIINAGCYILEKHQLDNFPSGEKFSLEQDYLQNAVKERGFELFITEGKFIDIGVPEDYHRAQDELVEYV